jgi:hypothetical protein
MEMFVRLLCMTMGLLLMMEILMTIINQKINNL